MAWLVCGDRVIASLEIASSRRERRKGLSGRDGIEPESTDGLVGSTVWVWVAAGLVCLGGPVGVGAR